MKEMWNLGSRNSLNKSRLSFTGYIQRTASLERTHDTKPIKYLLQYLVEYTSSTTLYNTLYSSPDIPYIYLIDPTYTL